MRDDALPGAVRKRPIAAWTSAATLAAALLAPVAVLAVWLALRAMRRSLARSESGPS